MTVFEPHHQPIMENIIHQWGVPNVCIKCHGRCPGKKCKSKNKNKKQGIKEVKTILSQNMDIVSTLDEAHLLSDDDSDSHPSVMNTSFFTTNVGHGSDSESVSDINDGFAGLFNNQKDVSSGEETYNDEKRAASEDSDDSAFNNNVLRISNSRGSKRRKHQTSQVNSDNNDDSSSNSEQSDSDTDSRSSEYSAFST